MADTEIVILDGVVFNDTEGGDEIVAQGVVLQEQTAAAGGGFQAAWAIGSNAVIQNGNVQ